MTLSSTWAIIKQAASGWARHKAARLAAAVAFYTILSVAPLFLIAVAIAGALFGREAATGALTDQLRDLLGPAGAEVARTTLEHADRPTGGVLATAVGVVTLLFGASGVFAELQDALNTMWDVKPRPDRGVWGTIQDRFLSFGMVLAMGFLLLVSLIVTTVLASLGAWLAGITAAVPVLPHVANFALSFLIITVLFATIFKFLPDAKIAWRDVWFGAVVTAALFTIGKYAIGFYLGKASVTTPCGAAGSLVAFVVWCYYSGLIVFFGAELTKVTARHAGRRIEPSANAEPASSAPEAAGYARV